MKLLSWSSKAPRSKIFAFSLLHKPIRLEAINILEVGPLYLLFNPPTEYFWRRFFMVIFSPEMITSMSELKTVFRRLE